jgi:ATP synthase F1 complex assembly factor 2
MKCLFCYLYFIAQFYRMLSQKVLNILYSRGTSATSLRYNSVYTLPKRFYKNVTVSGEENNGETLYSIQLDDKNLKTLAGKVLKVNSEPLALAVAQEWDAQKDFIHKSHMLLTGLSFTAMDNPFEDTKETLTSKIMEFFDTDTLLYFDGETQNLEKMQNERWGAIIKWANDTHGLNLRATNGLSEPPQITDQCRENVKRWLLSNNIWALNGLNYGTEAGKSILIMMALVAARITATEAAELSRLEQMYQAKIWGNVEWSHDIEHQTLCSRLSASALFYYFTSNFDVKKEISSSATA